MSHHQTDFVIEASTVESMTESLNLQSPLHLLPRLVRSAQDHARTPISGFNVGAVGLGADGRLFLGVNLEFFGLPLHQSVHAEQFLINNLNAHGCPRLLAFAVSAAPCGHCRQFLQELRHSSALQILILDKDNKVVDDEIPDFEPLSNFLPSPFGPHDLLDEESPFLLEQKNHRLDLHPDSDSDSNSNSDHPTDLRNGSLTNGNFQKFQDNESLLKKSALEAANASHAPYSACPSGIALMDCQGNLYKGSYIESAAYNPSLGPVQSALAGYVAAGGGGFERIVAAALVEKEGAKVRQEDTARLLLKTVSPKCEFRTFYCQSSG